MSEPTYPEVRTWFHVQFSPNGRVEVLSEREVRLLVNRLLAQLNKARAAKK